MGVLGAGESLPKDFQAAGWGPRKLKRKPTSCDLSWFSQWSAKMFGGQIFRGVEWWVGMKMRKTKERPVVAASEEERVWGHCRVVDITLFVLIAPAFVGNLKPRGRTRHGMGRTLHHIKPRPLPLENANCRSSQPWSRLATSFEGLRVKTRPAKPRRDRLDRDTLHPLPFDRSPLAPTLILDPWMQNPNNQNVEKMSSLR